MKKTTLAAMAALFLLLSACQPPAPPAESPTPSQSLESPPNAPSPGEPLPSPDTLAFPDFLKDFTFLRADALVTGGDSLEYITYWLSPEDLAGVREALQMDTWWEATDVPAMGMESSFALYDEEGRSLTVNPWDEEKCLILAKRDNDGFLYFAPISVLERYETYLSGLNFLPDFVRYFEFDQINVNHTPAEDGDYFIDHNVYLLDDAQQLSLLAALSPDTWTAAWDQEELTVSWYATLELLDLGGNKIVLVDWGEEKCLISCFFSCGGPVVRYWAPASVLAKTQEQINELSLLGRINNEAEWYYDLFWNDPGFPLLGAMAGSSGSISEDQMAAYTLAVLGHEGSIDFELGISAEAFDELTFKHFGKKLSSYDTSMSKVLPSGNVTATGWDSNYGLHPILTGTPETNSSGSTTAVFRLYTLDDALWFDGNLDPSRLNHAKEYLLSGKDSGYPQPQKVEITFRVETEEVYGLQREYLVYESLRLAEQETHD